MEYDAEKSVKEHTCDYVQMKRRKKRGKILDKHRIDKKEHFALWQTHHMYFYTHTHTYQMGKED